MFINKKTKIISTPVEEVLEVETPQLQQVSNIEFLTVSEDSGTETIGTLTDYEGAVYHYTWENKSKRLINLTGMRVDSLTWDLCDKVLNKYFIKNAKPVEEPIGIQIEKAVNKALDKFSNSIKNLENKVDKALAVKVAPAPAPVQVQSAPRPQSVQSTQMDAPAINVAEDDISANAMRFLQDSNVPDLGIDYMSLQERIMQAAEGKGPKQLKKPYVLGQFVTVYGNDGTPGAINPANPPYSPTVGTLSTISGGSRWNGGMVGSNVPGLNLNVNGNGATDVGFVCAPDPMLVPTDLETLYVDLWLEAGFSGTCYLQLQGSNNRSYGNTDYNSPAWVTILSGTVTSTSGNQTFTLNNLSATAEYPKMAYRVTASGGTGIIDWSIPGLFTDLSAMGVGSNAADTNGNIGQMSIQGPRYLTISGGQVTSTTNGTPPYAATSNNADYIGN